MYTSTSRRAFVASCLIQLRTSWVWGTGNLHRIGDTRNVYNIMVGIPANESSCCIRRRHARVTITDFKKLGCRGCMLWMRPWGSGGGTKNDPPALLPWWWRQFVELQQIMKCYVRRNGVYLYETPVYGELLIMPADGGWDLTLRWKV